ncbi:type III secretion system inner membrane ring subunit SctD [Robbsia sp. Bb-Pol-6]|uniref:Type III secretion system inner membrane ring subunit SctD n=1 Tax=Robbsia betulipollinis TaxID=2981849 RepID=A0ABT3ZL53_9BURK|nr:type III secretion system inner membrane ring subunit SctD [Robbsia betulipollinis]MCY0387265.1 type III secretion system inner membrane ring subunit SctD [Robbsia betulipollinis]
MKRKDQDCLRETPAFDATVSDGAGVPAELDDAGFDAAHAAFEFRVLAGLHAGARFAWPPATAASVRIGARADCDIVLQDAALAARILHVRLASDRRGWHVRETATPQQEDRSPGAGGDVPGEGAGEGAGEDANAAFAFGQALVLSGLACTVALAGTRWPTQNAALAGGTALAREEAPRADGATGARPDAIRDGALSDVTSDGPAPVHALRDASASRLDTDTKKAVAAAAATDADAPAAADRRARPRGWRRAGLPVAIAIGLAMPLVMMFTPLPGLLRHALPHAVASAHAGPPQNQSPAAVTKLLERLGLAQRLHLGTTDDGLIAVTGWLADTAQRDALADALAQLTPMPAMRVLIETEAVATAQQLADTFSATIEARYDGAGRVDLSGAIDTDTQRDALRRAFREQVPGAVLIDRHLLPRAAIEQALRDALRGAGIVGARVTWTTAALEIDAPAGTDADRFDRALTAFRGVYGKRLPLRARMGTASAPFVATGLPFAIVSVTGGALPSVVVAGGGRLLPGGAYRQYRLVSVEEGRIVFDGPRRVIVAR